MAYYLIHDVKILGGDQNWEHGWILVEEGRITQMGQMGEPSHPPAETVVLIDGTGKTAMPGFIDLHVHGAVGRDTMDATPDALQAIARFFATHGVTSFLATTMTADDPSTKRALENIARCCGPVKDGATILGAHLEGPYINVKMKGAQAGEHVRRANPDVYTEWLDLNVIRQVTVAPEFPENQSFIKACAWRGINISIGHTEASYEDVLMAITLGARQATHTFNAMVGLHHRKPGTAGAVLTEDEITCELIPDTIHVHPAVMKLLVRAKGIHKVALITDAIMGAGMPDGKYELGGQAVKVAEGSATLQDGTLAGSILTMDRGLMNIMKVTGLSLADVWPMTSANAARQLGIANRKGKLAVGYDADIVLLDEKLGVTLTMVEGRMAYRVR